MAFSSSFSSTTTITRTTTKSCSTSPAAPSGDDNSTTPTPLARHGPPRRWKFRMRGYDDQDATDWWFASTAIPLLAATIAPLANVLSIAALVTYWRMDLRDPNDLALLLAPYQGTTFKDPPGSYWINVGSLICGFIGNIFLLFNFTGRIRYIVALPLTITMWYSATAMVCSSHSPSSL
jgi:hypothetical protein